MPSSVAATLDLERAIEAFREAIDQALSIGDVGEWDGVQLHQREQSIRQASLVLAGQCIALLIHRLATNTQAHRAASERTKGMRHPGSEGVGRQEIRVTTVGNVGLKLRLAFVKGASKKRRKGRRVGQRGKALQGSYYPFLEWLGMSERVSPLVWTTVAQMGMLSSSFAQARDGLRDWGIRMSEGRVQSLVYRFGEAGDAIRQRAIEQMRAGDLATGHWLIGQRVVMAVDGGRARIRRNKRGKRLKSGRRGYKGQWKEPKLLTIYAVDEQGKRLKHLDIPLTNDGTMASVEGFMELLQMHCVRLGLIHAQQILLVSDGAEWIWSRIPTLLKTLGVNPERVIELIDFYHATTHLYTFADAAFSKTSEAKAWAKRACSQLKRGQINGLIKRMKTLASTARSKKKRTLAHKTLLYFSEQPQRFDYQRVQSLKLPIGSGAIESLIRQVINLRIKGTGKFWLKHHAELILLCRCQWAAGAWQAFCSNILRAKLSPVAKDNVLPFPSPQKVAA
ncbi:MAG: ISLre2 family transposase [Moorea sp. SIO3C2]|nr:ISLre2 family transposase [Moorena sp. SIO3C2]